MKKLLFILLILCIGSNLNAQVVDTLCAGTKGKVYRVIPNPGSTYYWYVDGGTITSDATTASITVDWGFIPGIYTVKVFEENNFGCQGDTVSVQIYITYNAKVNISGPAQACEGDTITLRASGASSYKWSTGDTTQIINYRVKNNNLLYVIGNQEFCDADTAHHSITVLPSPLADFTFNPHNPDVFEQIIFHPADTSALFYTWFFNDEHTSIDKRPSYIFYESGTHQIKLIVGNAAGCMDSILKQIIIDEEMYIYVPTAFSPNSDENNDLFNAVGVNIKTIEIVIYDRWGKILHTITDINEGWNGTVNGKPLPEGNYIYTLKATGTNNNVKYLKGSVTLIR